jgi:L-amino acid N-acyltransferase YncA
MTPKTSSSGALTIRRARPSDLAALADLVARCSEATLYRRFHGVAGLHIRRETARIAAPTPAHRSFVAVGPGGDIHGSATLAWARSGTVEVAFLVEDAWFRRGVGRALHAALVREARVAGVATVTATIQADNERALRFLRAVAPHARPRFVGDGEVEVRVPVPALAAPWLRPQGRATRSLRPVGNGEAA